MSVLLSNPPVAPEEYINTLEYYISSNFEDAKNYQFITEISAIELISISEIQNNISLLSKAISKYVEVSKRYTEILDRLQDFSWEDNAKALKRLAALTAQTIYQLKHQWLSDYLIEELKHPSIPMQLV